MGRNLKDMKVELQKAKEEMATKKDDPQTLDINDPDLDQETQAKLTELMRTLSLKKQGKQAAKQQEAEQKAKEEEDRKAAERKQNLAAKAEMITNTQQAKKQRISTAETAEEDPEA